MKLEVYDIETYNEAFIVCCKDIHTLQKTHFEISYRRNDSKALISHLKTVNGQIGYNTINFDYPILHWFINNYKNYNSLSLPQVICDLASTIIKDDFSAINKKEVLIPQLDLYRIWHFNSPARSTSLKWLEFAMRMDNIEDLPYGINDNLTGEKIDEIIDYCYHDVEATYLFYLESKGKISLRKKLTSKYKLPLMNSSDVGMAESLLLNNYCKKTGHNPYNIKNLRTVRQYLQGKDVILPIVSFKSEHLNNWLDKLKETYLLTPRGTWDGCVVKLDDEEYDIKLGGIHCIQKAKVFRKENGMRITERDAASLYPKIISEWGFYPEHLGPEFLELYTDILNERMAAKPKVYDETLTKEERDEYKLVVDTNKLQLNSSYGKMGSDLSYLYDLKTLYSTTINNQLFMLMLIEDLGIAGIKVISANTDSVTTYMHENMESTYRKIESDWQNLTKHILEDTDYQIIAYRDINNYYSLTTDNKIKCKGCFEKDRDWNKNHSMMIVPIALQNYYTYNTPIETTVKSHTDIFDFCKAAKGIGDAIFEARFWSNLGLQKYPLQKRVNRYIVSNRGVNLIKILPPLLDENGINKKDKLNKYRKENPNQLDIFHIVDDVVIEKDRESEVEAGYEVTMMNRIKSFNVSDYDINYSYYINECNKILEQITE